VSRRTNNKKGVGLHPDALVSRTNNGVDFKRLARMLGTKSVGCIRALWALMHLDEVSRENIDRYAGASNGPMLILQLRRIFSIEIPCERVLVLIEGRPHYPGRYSLTPADRAKLCALILRRHSAG
jgi:hypothetical protein